MGAGPVNQPASSKSSARHAVVGEDASLNPLKYFQIEWSGMSVWLCWVGLPATVLRHDQISARRQKRAVWKSEADPVRKIPPGQIHCVRARVEQLDELDVLGFEVRIVMNLVDDD